MPSQVRRSKAVGGAIIPVEVGRRDAWPTPAFTCPHELVAVMAPAQPSSRCPETGDLVLSGLARSEVDGRDWMTEAVVSKSKLTAEQFQKDNPKATDEQVRKFIVKKVALDTDLLETMNHLHITVNNLKATIKHGSVRRFASGIRWNERGKRSASQADRRCAWRERLKPRLAVPFRAVSQGGARSKPRPRGHPRYRDDVKNLSQIWAVAPALVKLATSRSRASSPMFTWTASCSSALGPAKCATCGFAR
jgi:hypothetical protein